jgi:hypothetical protein
MAQRIRLTFPSTNVSADVELRPDVAPATCAALWKALPLFATAHHAVYSGSEGVLLLPTLLQVEPENATADVTTGDVAFTWFAPGDAYGVEAPFAEICWFYDSDGKPSMPEGPVPVSVFGRFIEPADAFYAATRQMRREGVRGMSVERVEGITPEHAIVHRPAHGHAVGPSAVQRTDGVLLVAFTLCVDSTQPNPRCLPVLSQSDDGGRAWSAPRPIEGYAWVGSVVRFLGVAEDDTLIAVLEDSATGTRSCLASHDNGSSWEPTQHPVAPPPVTHAHWESGEHHACLVTEGVLHRVMALAGPGTIAELTLSPGHRLLIYAAWDGLPNASVPGICGIHATHLRTS